MWTFVTVGMKPPPAVGAKYKNPRAERGFITGGIGNAKFKM